MLLIALVSRNDKITFVERISTENRDDNLDLKFTFDEVHVIFFITGLV